MRSLLSQAILQSPEFLGAEILGLTLKNFHRAWLRWQMDNRCSLILAPRGHGKSTVCSALWSAWKIISNPDIRVLLISSSAEHAQIWLHLVKRFLCSELLSFIFTPAKGLPWNEENFTVSWRINPMLVEPTMVALGLEGPITGKHVDMLILDDIVTMETARSAVLTEKLANDYYMVILPCLLEGGEIHILGTRYHPQDFYDFLLTNALDKCAKFNSLEGRLEEFSVRAA